MLKKLGIVTALSAAFIFGGAFDSVDAKADVTYKYNIYYSINGEQGSVSGDNLGEAKTKVQNIANQVMSKYNLNWNSFNWQPTEKVEINEPEQNAETPVQEKEEQPVQEEPQAPVEEEPAQEQVQQPAQEQAAEDNQSQTQEYELNQFEQEVVDLTNQERAKYGLSPLQVDIELSKVAREKSRDMAVNNYFDHNSPTYGSPFDMMKSYGVSYQTAGENIAKGQRTPAEVVNAWMNSDGHRANILNENFTHIGVGYVEQGNHWTQQFIGK
ncbi:CAP domain-containing protein [Oceanobacillus salinisoli]|uniref:CAP domain-containing protein n=1 Tax=Oceanobacillus salinisoli TaxID=2678611 RepID=UPI0012E23EF6|nr:CAP domain-containing protein [Oceanobacillus salinisoli]